MHPCDSRPLQCFVAPEIHLALKLEAAHNNTTIAAIVRGLVTDYCRAARSVVAGEHDGGVRRGSEPNR